MKDAGRIVGGLVAVCAVIALPVWIASARGAKTAVLPRATGESCVEPPEQMRKQHPALLATWRERVVRFGDRVHDKADGSSVRISLTGTCLGCHGNATQFCDQCHARSAVTLSCWGCHAPAAGGR